MSAAEPHSTLSPETVYVGPGGVLAVEIGEFIRRFLLISQPAIGLLPMWVLHTWVFRCFEFTPYLNIVSPEPGCGKTTAADVLSSLCANATNPTCGSAAFLRHKIASDRPTLLLDEWDSLDPAIRRLCINFLNTGFKSDGTYGLISGGMSVELSTFSPKAIIGRALVRLPEATMSRCIPVAMHRALPTEKLERFAEQQRQEAGHLREQCEAWATEFQARKVRPHPVFPEGLSGRQQQVTGPLLEIADFCGGPWPLALRNSVVRIFERPPLPIAENELLRAVKRYTSEHKEDHLWSKSLCDWLNAQEDAPWLEGTKQRKMSQAKLAEMLRHYDIFATQINRVVKGRQRNQRGYWVRQFDEVFARYL